MTSSILLRCPAPDELDGCKFMSTNDDFQISAVDISVGKRVRELRILSGLSRNEVAELISQDVAAVDATEAGFRRLRASEIITLAQAFRVSLCAFFDELDVNRSERRSGE